MKSLNIAVWVLLVVGGLNWLMVGLFQFDLVAAIFGGNTGNFSSLSRIVFVVVGLAALYGLTLFKPLTMENHRIDIKR